MWRAIALLAEAYILMYAPLSCANDECPGYYGYDAWQFLESFPEFWVKYKTYIDSKRCESLSQTEKNAASQYALYKMSFTSTDDNRAYMVTRLYQTEACSNHLYVFEQDGQLLHNVTLTYSDYSNCAVIVNNDDTTQCTVWVKAAATEDVARNCRDKLNDGCSKTARDDFNPDVCSLTS